MSYLARLKNLKGTDTHTTKPTELRFVGFVAPIPAPFQNSRDVLGGVGETITISADDPTVCKVLPPVPADWQTLERAYEAHHVGCLICTSAGKGYGLRCDTGAALWAAYEAVDIPVGGKVSPMVSTEAASHHSWEANAVDQPPLPDTEKLRNAARLALFDARGLTSADAEKLASKLLVRDWEGDRRGACAECHFLVGNRPDRWMCSDRSSTSLNDLAGACLGGAFVHHNLHHCQSRKEKA